MMLYQIKKMDQHTDLMAVVITDVKNKDTVDYLSKFSEGRIYQIETPGPNLAALTCVVPL